MNRKEKMTAPGAAAFPHPGERGRFESIYLSMVIPALNEERRLPATFEKLYAFLEGQGYPFEVLVIDNGSDDGTAAVTRVEAGRRGNLRYLREEERGKGLAVRRGMIEARGQYRFLCDADLSMPVEEISRFLPPAMTGCDVVISTREGAGARVYGESFIRRGIGRAYNLMVRALVLPGIRDTQCGFKCFTARAAEAIFPRQRIMGLAFDVETLVIARDLGLSIGVVPISWYFDPDSRIRMLRDSTRMAADLMRIRANRRRGLYGP